MKALKLILVIMAAALVTVGLSEMSYALHSGGTAYCEACHTMHNSLGGKQVSKGGSLDVGVNYLLKGTDQSSTCLVCHASSSPPSPTTGSIAVMTSPTPAGAPVQRSPGGDFGWLLKNYNSGGTANQNPGNSHGHNIIATDYGLGAVGASTAPTATAPGGTYSSNNLYCTSCHDPHSNTRITGTQVSSSTRVKPTLGGPAVGPITGSGSYAGSGTAPVYPTATAPLGVYRLLGDVNYLPVSYSGGPKFTSPPPVAVAPSLYNQSEATNEVRVAYGVGMSEWCSNCHPNILNSNSLSGTTHIHPAGAAALLNQLANMSGTTTYSYLNIYNAYRWSGNLSGTQSTSYTSLVPYEEGSNDLTVIGPHASNTKAMYSTTGPYLGTENAQCLSCHRAHASGFPQATRWYNNYQFITLAGGVWPGATANSQSDYMPQLDYQAAMYDHQASVFGGTTGFQRALCNKCHGKD